MRSVVPLVPAALLAATLPLAVPAHADSAACVTDLEAPVRGTTAVAALGAHLPEAAQAAGMGPRRFERTLREDRTLWVDECGQAFYVEPAGESPGAFEATEPASPDPLALHSRPGAQRTLFLDFDGHEITGTGWNDSYTAGAAFTAEPYTRDSDPAFSATEFAAIEDVWRRVAEDYAPFDVDITTQDPGQAALTRSDITDRVFGTRVVISPTTTIYGTCRCGGIAYLGAFDTPSGHDYFQPALVFTRGVGTGSKGIAEAASHEAGHTFGLVHDGTAATPYYSGQGAWAPIMGIGYYRPVTQWSRGDYSSANNTEDDLAIVAASGAPRVSDETDTRSLTPGTESGLIGTSSDTDRFSFTASGATALRVRTTGVSPNLDAQLSLYDSDGALVASSDPAATMLNADLADGLGAGLDVILAPGLYTGVVEGVGAGSPAGTGYSDYGSLGRYEITLATTPTLIVVAPSAPTGEVGRPYAYDLQAGGGSLPYSWTTTALPPGLTMADNGEIRGAPTAPGSYGATVKVRDASGNTATAVLEIPIAQVAPMPAPSASTPAAATAVESPQPATALRISTRHMAPAIVGKRYRTLLISEPASGRWARTGGTLPKGLQLSKAGVVRGVPRQRGRFRFVVSVTVGDLRTQKALVMRVRRG